MFSPLLSEAVFLFVFFYCTLFSGAEMWFPCEVTPSHHRLTPSFLTWNGTWLSIRHRTHSQAVHILLDNTKRFLAPDCNTRTLRHKSLISMHMVQINLCMQMECPVSQNYTMRVIMYRPPTLFDMNLMNEIRIKTVGKTSSFVLSDWFYFHWKNKRACFLFRSFNLFQPNLQNEWKMIQTVQTFVNCSLYRECTATTQTRRMLVVICSRKY